MQSEMTMQESEKVHLCDGTPVFIRPICPDDAPHLQSLFGRLSAETIAYRFMGRRKELPYEEAKSLADVDSQTQMALVARCEQHRNSQVIGVARFALIPGTWPAEAEAAIVVEDRYQGRGLGTLLLQRLVACARERGIHTFLATVRYDNARMLRFIRHSGLPTESRVEAGVWEIRVGLGS